MHHLLSLDKCFGLSVFPDTLFTVKICIRGILLASKSGVTFSMNIHAVGKGEKKSERQGRQMRFSINFSIF